MTHKQLVQTLGSGAATNVRRRNTVLGIPTTPL
jgi:hypothetical protein